ncbi:MAG: hypothetical protein Q9184_004063 [Pyrenodesmia sp. 2 TL-2023]
MSTVEVVAEPENGDEVRIDLVFVHALSDGWQFTWKKDGLSWIQDFVPKDIPHARIFALGSKKDSALSIRGLQEYERKRDHEKRPVIFFAHSLGGLILQSFLQNCTLLLQTSTKGIMFFSTPNSLQQEDQRTRFASAMASIHYTFEDGYLSRLGSISEGFSAWLDDRPFAGRVVCFYETLPITDDGMVVGKESAVLPRCEVRGLHANHMSITQFPSASDTNYRIVLQCMKSMYCLADESMRVLLRHSLRASPHGRVSNLPTTPDGCEEVIVSTQGTPVVRDIARLALIAEDQGHYKEAEEKYQEVVTSLDSEKYCSPAVRDLGRLAVAHAERDPGVEVEKEFESVSILLRSNELAGRDDAAILFCVHKWACLMHGGGRYRHAELYSRYCVKARIKLYGKGSNSTLLTTANWVSSMISLGMYQEARNTIRDALENQDLTFLGKVSAVQMLETFAKLASECDRHDLAESVSCDVLRKAIDLYGDEHPFTLNCMSELAAILAHQGNLSSAEALSRRSLDGLEQTLGNDHPECLRAARRLADYICLQQRYDDAILRHKQILTKQRLRIGNQHLETLLTMRSLGIDFALHRYWKDAEMILDRTLGDLEACLGSDDKNTVYAAGALKTVKELQEKRALQAGVMKPDLLKVFAPQPNPNSDHEFFNYTHGPSLFQTAVEDKVLRAVIDRNEEALKGILIEEPANEQILGRALREAAASSHEPTLKLLLTFDAPVNAQSGYHGSALQAASLAGSGAIVELLLGHNADVNQEGGIFGNALRAAVFRGHDAILCLLLRSAPPSGLSQNVLNTSIQLAVRTENRAMIDNLISAGADINAEDKLFGSPLQQASFYGQEEIIEMLLKRNSDINMRGGLLSSPLQAAIETQNESTIKQLLRAGANTRSILPDGLIPTNRQEGLAKILLNHLTDSLPYRPLSVVSGSYDSMQISKQPVRNMTGSTGSEPLSGTHHDSKSLLSVPMASEKALQPTPVSTMKRSSRFKSGGNTHGPTKAQSIKNGLKRKSKRTIQSLRKRLSMLGDA